MQNHGYQEQSKFFGCWNGHTIDLAVLHLLIAKGATASQNTPPLPRPIPGQSLNKALTKALAKTAAKGFAKALSNALEGALLRTHWEAPKSLWPRAFQEDFVIVSDAFAWLWRSLGR